MGQTSIEWTDQSINPIRAYHRRTGAVGHYCELVSPGCAHCYASALQRRFSMPGYPGKSQVAKLKAYTTTGRIILTNELEVGLEQHALDQVLKRKKPTKWFWCDMTDMFGWWVGDYWLDRMFAVMNATAHKLPIPADLSTVEPWHTHQVLTKRPERMAEYIASRHAAALKGSTHPLFSAGRSEGGSLRGHGTDIMNAGAVLSWPLSNVWLGTSAENQKQFNERVPHLNRTPAAVRFLSLEPLLGSIDISAFCESYTTRWVIIGAESGPQARPTEIAWIRSIVEQCRAYGVACFVKQIGRYPLGGPKSRLDHPKGGDPAEWPEDLRVREFPTSHLAESL
jgi:protein gp37